MITFFHTADIHFGVENYGRIDPKTGIHTRLLDFKKAFETSVDQAIKEQVDFFLIAGDAYKTPHPTPTQQKLLMQVLFKLYKAGIPVVIVVGNHDHPLSFGKANALDVFNELPLDGFHVFSKPGLIRLETKNGPVQIVGVPWPTRHNVVAKDEHRQKKTSDIIAYLSKRVSEIISELATQLDPNLPAILTGHLTVSNGIFSGSEKCAIYGTDPLFLPSQLALPEFDYVALGHLHRYQDLNADGYPSVVYSGSTDRVDFGERKETKGYCRVKIDTSDEKSELHRYKTRGTHEFVPLNTRPFLQVELTLEKGKDQTEQIITAIEAHNIVDAVVKIRYHVPSDMQDTIDLRAVERACSSAHYVVGVIPIRTQPVRVARAALKVHMNFDTLISRYIDTKDEYKEMKDRILQKAHAVHAESEAGEE